MKVNIINLITGVVLVTLYCCAPNTVGQKENTTITDYEKALAFTKEEGNVRIAEGKLGKPMSDGQLKRFLIPYADEPFLLFPETRENEIRFYHSLPEKWIDKKASDLTHLKASARPGEFFVFQIGVWANTKDIIIEKISASGLADESIQSFTCFNLEGTDFKGNTFHRPLKISKYTLQPLWMGLQIPESATGKFNGSINMTFKGQAKKDILLTLDVKGEKIERSGTNDSYRLSRLKWLNSKIAINNDVTKGFLPITRNERTFDLLGRQFTIDSMGLPSSIGSFFTGANEKLKSNASPILSRRVRFILEKMSGEIVQLHPSKIKFSHSGDKKQEWQLTANNDEIELLCKASASFDGFLDYSLQVKSKKTIHIKDIRLEIPFTTAMSEFMMGMNKEGGTRPETWEWKWDVTNKNQDALWVGGVNGGLRIKLKGADYKRPLVNIYYPLGHLNMPKSWGNDNKGGVQVLTLADREALVRVYSGPRTLHPEDNWLEFNFEFLITPLKLANKDIRYNDRYFHRGGSSCAEDIQLAQDEGANIINIHHRRELNPFINYPYLSENMPALEKFTREAHAKNIRVKPYYTTRELTVYTPEIWALRSLNEEIIYPNHGKIFKNKINPDGPDPWLIDNFYGTDGYIPAWKCVLDAGKDKGAKDLSVITVPDSRWNNYFLEGLDFITRKAGTDGIYIDDCALDRETMQRARKILDTQKSNARIDFHSWNHFKERAGWACCMNLYMDLMPYIDLMWIGESRDYNTPPDYWLVEISGIPFGLISQMLEHGGNNWRGMVFGITNRSGYHKETSPDQIWKFWDKYKFIEKEMIGFWDKQCPVKTDNSQLICTVYKGKGQAIIAVGNWASTNQMGKLLIDWDKLGMDPKKTKIAVPRLEAFQNAQHLEKNLKIDIPAAQGLLIVLTENGIL